jgi:hypothetical protein
MLSLLVLGYLLLLQCALPPLPHYPTSFYSSDLQTRPTHQTPEIPNRYQRNYSERRCPPSSAIRIPSYFQAPDQTRIKNGKGFDLIYRCPWGNDLPMSARKVIAASRELLWLFLLVDSMCRSNSVMRPRCRPSMSKRGAVLLLDT